MGKLRSPEEVKASKLEATAKYLEHAEKALSDLLGPLFGEDRVQTTDGFMAMFGCPAMSLRSLVMAMRRYPTFDVSCLSSMKRFTYVQRVGSTNKKVEVMVPTFGARNLDGAGEIRFSLLRGESQNYFEVGNRTKIYFDHAIQERNRMAMKEAGLDNAQSWDSGDLVARVPTIPVDVRKRIEDARPCFDRLTIVWEAEWGPAPVVDPLIIGSVDGNHFLVDQYDVTKLERYISSEMTKSPLK